jgi:hypothetical protein
MDKPEGRAAHRRGPSYSELQEQVTDFAAQRLAISEVLPFVWQWAQKLEALDRC